jgi:flagellar hook protein FlgE
MLTSLNSGISALDQFQQSLDVIGNNIANVDTVGFKSANVNFADALNQTLGSNASGSQQVGTGVLTASITNQFTQGSVSSTGVQSDLAINGNGFFLVKDPSTGTEYATRDGDFTVDTNGYLVTSTGMRVQGYSDVGLSTMGDIKVDSNGAVDASGNPIAVQSYTFGSDGKLTETLADGTSLTRGQVLLQNFTSPTQLTKAGNNLYSNLTAAGAQTASAPNNNGLGNIVAGSLEMSNVDLAGQLTNLITTQRAYEANAKVITTSDQILQDIDNLGR